MTFMWKIQRFFVPGIFCSSEFSKNFRHTFPSMSLIKVAMARTPKASTWKLDSSCTWRGDIQRVRSHTIEYYRHFIIEIIRTNVHSRLFLSTFSYSSLLRYIFAHSEIIAPETKPEARPRSRLLSSLINSLVPPSAKRRRLSACLHPLPALRRRSSHLIPQFSLFCG